MTIVAIECVKKGEPFRLLNKSEVVTIQVDLRTVHQIAHLAVGKVERKPVYVASGYNKSIKKYEGHKYSDINSFTTKKKGTLVLIDFDF
jgi:hypothetical protein